MSFLELAQARYSERHFASTPLEPEKLEYILEAVASLPLQKTTSHNAFWLCKARKDLNASMLARNAASAHLAYSSWPTI